MKPLSVLWATKIGNPDWMEQIITETYDTQHLEMAKEWAVKNGFDRLRVYEHIDGLIPDFVKTLNI